MKEKRNNSQAVQETLKNYAGLKESLTGNGAESAIRDMLDEEIRKQFGEIIAEAEEKDYEEDEVDDILTEPEESEDGGADEEEAEPEEDEPEAEEGGADGDDAEEGEEVPDEGEEDGDDWEDFDEYKVGDDEYDFSNAEDEDVVKVFKLLTGDEEIGVKKVDGGLKVTDGETGSEYLIQMDDEGEEDDEPSDIEGCEDGECEILLDYEDEDEEPMEESFEIVLEDNGDYGYTDDYQKKTPVTFDRNQEPSKSGRNIDKGVPYGDSKRWSGLKKQQEPYIEVVSEEDDVMENFGDEEEMTEGANTMSRAQRRKMTKSPSHNLPEYDPQVSKLVSRDGKMEESVLRKLDAIVKENRSYKKAIAKMKGKLVEAAVTNVNLGQIIKLITENSTTKEEKKDIIRRFSEGAKTVKESNALYESISRELKKNPAKNGEAINPVIVEQAKPQKKENVIYESKELSAILDLMDRTMKR